jgi:DNA helicase-2/ATP-dependent DNA helicase PcrA
MEKIYLTKLNLEQLQIATNNEFLNCSKYAMCIIACAGSGKTTTIISKIIYMIKDLKCDPEHFFITTFTRNAAGELKERLYEYLTEKQVDQMTIGTFHSIAYKHVSKYNNFNNAIEDTIEKYLYDYLDLLKSKKYNRLHKYIFIDEYQDINEIQENIIKQLYEKSKLLVTVGDDQQNIYTFRKTSIKYILDFKLNYKNSHYFYLNRNYRSQKYIIDLANIVLSYNENKLDKELISMSDEKIKKIKVMGFPNQYEELKYFVDWIYIKYIDSSLNIQLHEIAIISRNNSSLQKIEAMLADKKIPTYYLETIQDNKITRENIQRIKNRVILSTIHGTKGLEFKNVFILDLKQGVFPSILCNDIEEERRLFYVGITRAKQNLILCYTENKPSQFLKEITLQDTYLELLKLNIPIPQIDSINIIPYPEIYSVTNIIGKLTHIDFETIRNEFFDYKNILFKTDYLHLEIPIYFSDFFKDRNLIISNISNIFGDFMETFVSRCILESKNISIDNHDYIMMCLLEVKYYVKKLEDLTIRGYIDKKYGTKLTEKSQEYILKIKSYFDSGIEIKGRLLNHYKNHFISGYKSYISQKQSSNIIFDLFIISLIKGISRGRTSLQHLINFSDNFNSKKINKEDLENYKTWLYSVQIGCTMFVKDIDKSNIFSQYTIRDNQTQIKGIIDILIDDHIIEIKSYTNPIPQVEMLIQLLSYVGLARRKGMIINKASIYNPIHGNIYTWDVSQWIQHDELIEFMSDCVKY